MSAGLTAEQALESLKQGNCRFVEGKGGSLHYSGPPRGTDSTRQQEPIAIILGCSDSRVPAELVFDQGFGDLFVIRVAGNIVAPSQIASVEFAVKSFGTPLVLVLGHTQCGAVLATIDELRNKIPRLTGPIRTIVDRVRPAVEKAVAGGALDDSEELIEAAVKANVQASVEKLREGSEVIKQLMNDSGLKITGAEYSLETGEVEFFD